MVVKYRAVGERFHFSPIPPIFMPQKAFRFDVRRSPTLALFCVLSLPASSFRKDLTRCELLHESDQAPDGYLREATSERVYFFMQGYSTKTSRYSVAWLFVALSEG